MKLGVFFVLLGLYYLTQVMVVVGYSVNAEGIGYLLGYSILPILLVVYGSYRIKKSLWSKRRENVKENQK